MEDEKKKKKKFLHTNEKKVNTIWILKPQERKEKKEKREIKNKKRT